jgi:hypothetical protein
MKNKATPFAEFRQFLNSLGFKDKCTEKAWVFHHPSEGLLIFRVYADNDNVAERDLRSTRRFLDMRGLLAADGFDAFLHRATPA